MGRKQNSKDFKVGAINQVVQEGKSVSKVAKELGIIPIMLSRWVCEYKNYGDATFSGNGKKIANSDFKLEIMKKRVEELELENKLLKKFQIFLQEQNK